MWYLIVSISDLCILTYYDVIHKNSVVAPSGLGCCPFEGGGSVYVDSLFIVAPIVVGRFCVWSLFWYGVLIVLSKFAIIFIL